MELFKCVQIAFANSTAAEQKMYMRNVARMSQTLVALEDFIAWRCRLRPSSLVRTHRIVRLYGGLCELRNNMMVCFANGLPQASADAILALRIVYAGLVPKQCRILSRSGPVTE